MRHALFTLLVAGLRVVNSSSSTGRLSLIPGDELREKLSSPLLTVDEPDALMRTFVDMQSQGRRSRADRMADVRVQRVQRGRQRA